MKRVMHSELAGWLKTATQGLPAREAAVTEMELYSHYLDACDAYREQGKSADEAHRQAMIDLGAAESTSAGLRDVHIGTRRYTIASVLSLMVLLVLYGMPLLYSNLGFAPFSPQSNAFYAVFIGSLFVLSTTVMRVVRDLLTWRFGVRGLSIPFWMMAGGLGIYVVTEIIALSLFRYAVGFSNSPGLFALTDPAQIVLALVSFASQMSLAVGLMAYAARIQPVRNQLYGLGLPISILLSLLAIGVAGSAIAVAIDSVIVETLMIFLENVTHTVLWPVLVLLFYRAIYRRAALPRQFA